MVMLLVPSRIICCLISLSPARPLGPPSAPSKKHRNHIDAHTKGPRDQRPIRNETSGGHTSRGGGGRGARTPAQGGERRQYERRSGGIPDSQKKVDQGWGADDGEVELTGGSGRL